MSWRPHKGTLSGDDKPSCARTHRSVLPPPWFDMEHLQGHQDPAVKSFQHCTASPPLEQERECREAGAAPLRTSPRNVDEGRTGCRLVRSREGIAACCLSPLPQSARHAKRALKLLKKSAIVLRQQTRAQTRAIVWGRNVLVALVLLISGLDFVMVKPTNKDNFSALCSGLTTFSALFSGLTTMVKSRLQSIVDRRYPWNNDCEAIAGVY